MPITQAILCIILAVGVLTIFFLAGTIIGGLHAYSKAYTEVEEAHSNLDKAKEELINSLEGKCEAQKELIDSYEHLLKAKEYKDFLKNSYKETVKEKEKADE